jgi:hypothetical protein
MCVAVFRGGCLIQILPTLFGLGLVSGAAAFEPQSIDEGEELAEIAEKVEHWSERCIAKDKSRHGDDARQCWWDAAKMLDEHISGDHPLLEAVRKLRVSWLWRSMQLTLEAADTHQKAAVILGSADARYNESPPAYSTRPVATEDVATATKAGKFRAASTVKSSKHRRKAKATIAALPAVHQKEMALPTLPLPPKPINFSRPLGWKSRNVPDRNKLKHKLF